MRIRDHLAEAGEPAFRFRQLVTAWRSSTAENFADVHALPARLRGDLAERFGPRLERYPLARSLDILDRQAATSHRKVYLAYLLIADVNDSAEHLAALAALVHQRSRPELFHVSVIRYNEAAGAAPEYRAPSPARTDEFVHGLTSRGVHATRRRQSGTGIDAACGQLHARYLSTHSPKAAPVEFPHIHPLATAEQTTGYEEPIPVTPVGG
ncbi:hypothetical protein [Micromonospora sp. NPDC023737]|uniref:hypothetical protein n=1 Tax=unclassified Micromonospora TaxID=2617518 RepID=UPI0033D705CE